MGLLNVTKVTLPISQCLLFLDFEPIFIDFLFFFVLQMYNQQTFI